MMLTKKIINKERGVALLIVTLMVVLLSMLVMQVSHSTFLYSRSIGRMERNVQSEYLLKSVLNVAVAMIEQDTTPNYDSVIDIWGQFSRGVPIPEDYLAQLGINYPGVDAILEIHPGNSKINIGNPELIASGSSTGTVTQVALASQYATSKLFENLGFDDGMLFETSDQFSPIQRKFNSRELTSNIIDFYDNNSEDFTTTQKMPNGESLPDGIESYLPENYFPEKGVQTGQFEINELLIVPGMTPSRLRTIIPFVNVHGRVDYNVNLAPREVLISLHPAMDETVVSSIIQHRETQGPFQRISELNNFVNLSDLTGVTLTVRSKFFEILAMVRFGDTKAHYIRAKIKRSNPSTPADILSITMY